jgi:hypothetical protein
MINNSYTFVPDNPDELFQSGEKSYYFHTDEELDNIQSMQAFLDMVGVSENKITCDDGTQVFLSNGNVHLQLDSGGLGDFYSHEITVTKLRSPVNESRRNKLNTILREIIDEVLDEMTGTGAVAGYQTPNAFQGGSGDASRKKKIAARSMPGGKVVGESDESDDKPEEELLVRRSLGEARGRYLNYRDSDVMKTHAKVSYGIKEAHSMLREVEFLVGLCERLKTESGTSNDQLWKRTAVDVSKIHQRLKEIARRVNRLRK